MNDEVATTNETGQAGVVDSEKPKAPDGQQYEAGMPEEADHWRDKLRTRKEMLSYLKTGERCWTSTEGFGSEKRKNPA